MDKNIFISVELAEIKREVRDNGRDIADNSLRLMKIDDDIADIKAMQEEYSRVAKEHYVKMDTLFDELRKIIEKLNVNEVEVDRLNRKMSAV